MDEADERNHRLAIRWFGWKWYHVPTRKFAIAMLCDPAIVRSNYVEIAAPEGLTVVDGVPHFSTDGNAMLLLLAKIVEAGYDYCLSSGSGQPCCEIFKYPTEEYAASAATLPEAVAKAVDLIP